MCVFVCGKMKQRLGKWAALLLFLSGVRTGFAASVAQHIEVYCILKIGSHIMNVCVHSFIDSWNEF